MKYIYILLLLVFWQVNILSAQMEVSVELTHFLTSYNGNSTNGSISITVSGSEYVPYTIQILQGNQDGPCLPQSSSIQSNTATYTFLFNDTDCAGTYCFLIIGETTDEFGEVTYCYAEVCATIEVCIERLIEGDEPGELDYVTRYCGDDIPKKEKSLTGKTPIYLVGYVNQFPDDGTTYFDFLVDSPYNPKLSVPELVLQQTGELSALIYEKGKSDYDIPSQDDIDVQDANFIFKYDERGNIEWVYHNFGRDLKKYPEVITNELETEHFNNASLSINKVFPNPFRETVHLQLESAIKQNIEIYLLDVLGRQLLSSKHLLQNGQNQIDMQMDSGLMEGIYLLQLISEDKQTLLIHKLVHTK